jgi:3-deoxy-D-manno-octulosonic-acid transferase
MLNISIFFYNIFLALYAIGIRIASRNNEKAKKWLDGRTDLLEHIKATLKPNETRIWMHCASLGEFEQGRTLLELIKSRRPELKIVLTFFSPSGYEVRKDYQNADYVFYLPLDGKTNSASFLDIVKPKFVIFVKYEFWYHYFRSIERAKIPFIIISAVFRKTQPFFKWYGWLFRKMLSIPLHIFVQDKYSQNILKEFDLGNVTVCGDTRVDRVISITNAATQLPIISKFLAGFNALIVGSAYIEESQLILKAIKDGIISEKIILVPHSVDNANIEKIKLMFGDMAALYSSYVENDNKKQVLIIDTIGILSKVYKYGSLALIGGGFGKGIHNILEPAAFGLPVMFGPHHHKFMEANEMLASNAAFSFDSYESFCHILNHLKDENELSLAGDAAKFYVNMNAGSSEKIYKWLEGRNFF